MKKIIALLLATLLVCTLAGCNNKTEGTDMKSAEADVSGPSVAGEAPAPNATLQQSDSPVIADYTLVEASQDGEALADGEFPPLKVTLREDGTGTYGTDGNLMDIFWILEGNQYTFISSQLGPENPLVLTVDGDTLVAVDGNLEMIFQKQ